MNTGVVLASGGGGSNGGFVAVVIVGIIFAAIAVSIVSFFQLQKHRADSVAYAAYRKLAEEAVEKQDQLLTELQALDLKVGEIERLLRSVE
jgi:type II secretory pathway pseudopilin PulG